MKKLGKELGNLLITLFYKLVSLIVLMVPDRARYKIGVFLGKLLLRYVKSYTDVAYKNMHLVFKNKFTSEEIDRLVAEHFTHLGLVAVEFILLQKLNRNNFRNYIDLRIEGEEHLKAAHARGKGVIIYSAHLGNWEWLGAILSFLGYPVTAIAQPLHNKSFNRTVNKTRQATGIKLISTRRRSAQRDAYLALKNNKCLFILGDQYPVSNGWPVTFFGQATYAFSGVIRFAKKTGAAILPSFLVRDGWRKHRLIFLKPYVVEKDLNQSQQEELLQTLTDHVEEMIRKHLPQWLWIHERWR